MAELLPKSDTEQAEERMAAVERQIHKHIPAGVRHNLLCPYCGSWNFPHQTLCCDLMRRAVLAVLIADRAMKAAVAGEKHGNN